MSDYAELIEQLGDGNGLTRQRARLALVDAGKAAVPALIAALGSLKEHKRWEAAKALGAIPDDRATEALVATLEDRAFGVRWLAANALIEIGEPVLPQVLRALIERSDSPRLREGAGHVIRSIGRRSPRVKTSMASVLDALESVEPITSVPWAAREVLRGLGLIPHSP